jgi:hemolysin III
MKPLLRGVSHQIACVVALLVGGWLVVWAPTSRGSTAAAIYGASLTTLFGVSALYHRPTWPPAQRAWLRRVDHSAIFILIAGTYTPFCLLLPPEQRRLLWVVWSGAALGVVQSIAWVRAPKVLVAVLYLLLGWCVVPFFHSMREVMTRPEITLMAVGGAAYSAGAVVYALRRPNPWPTVFGYHEIFHALTIVAAACHFRAVIGVVGRLV